MLKPDFHYAIGFREDSLAHYVAKASIRYASLVAVGINKCTEKSIEPVLL